MNPEILKKLAKLMELGKSDNEHEATLAGERAAELMAKHQITMAEVMAHNTAESTVAVESGRVDAELDTDPMSKRRELWMEILLVGIVEGVGGKAWKQTRGKNYMFWMVGPPDTVSAARYMFLMLDKEVGRLARKEMKRLNESNSFRRAYARGMAIRICERIRQQRAAVMSTAGTALVHVTRQEKAVADAIAEKNLKETHRGGGTKTPDAIRRGYIDGEKVDIGADNRRGLGEGRKALPGE